VHTRGDAGVVNLSQWSSQVIRSRTIGCSTAIPTGVDYRISYRMRQATSRVLNAMASAALKHRRLIAKPARRIGSTQTISQRLNICVGNNDGIRRYCPPVHHNLLGKGRRGLISILNWAWRSARGQSARRRTAQPTDLGHLLTNVERGE